jgi:hypothetical protein
MPIPEYLMNPLRERLGLEDDDTSRDSEINAREPMENLRELSAWEFGDSGWAVQKTRDEKKGPVKNDQNK